MPAFREDLIVIIAPGSQTTLAQLGLPESFSPPRMRIPSRMYKTEHGLWSHTPPDLADQPQPENGTSIDEAASTTTTATTAITANRPVHQPEPVWPIVKGQIVNWDCFQALISHVISELNHGFHSPYMIISDPSWTVRDCEQVTQFIFERFKPPAFAMIDAAVATCYGLGLPTGTVIDIGYQKVDITAISDHLVHERSRLVSMTGCGGDDFTKRLSDLLRNQGFNDDMSEQLKRSAICEILAPGMPLPGTSSDSANDPAELLTPAAILSSASAQAGTGGDEIKVDEEGVMDVTSILASDNMTDILSKKEREKAEKQAKKTGDAAANQKQQRLRNCERVTSSFVYRRSNRPRRPAEATGPQREGEAAEVVGEINPSDDETEIEVGLERFKAASGGIVDRIAEGVFKAIQTVDETNRRSDLWDSIVLVGNGSKVRGLKEALMVTLRNKFLITPSSGTTSYSLESTATSARSTTPMNPSGQNQSNGSSLLVAATTGASLSQALLPQFVAHNQTPTSIKFCRVPEYFPDWKECGYEEGVFLGGQVASRVLFISDQANNNKGYMTRSDYNEMGPSGIIDFRI